MRQELNYELSCNAGGESVCSFEVVPDPGAMEHIAKACLHEAGLAWRMPRWLISSKPYPRA